MEFLNEHIAQVAKSRKCSMPDCDQPPRYKQRYCAECHSKYMRAWRAKRKRQEQELRDKIVTLRKRVMELEREQTTRFD